MIDHRKLSSLEILTSGILNRPGIKSNAPEDMTWKEIEEGANAKKAVLAALESGSGAKASMFYGCWHIWPTPRGFSGMLKQYRSVTDQFDDLPIEEAIDKAEEWAGVCRE